jgi:hypothetical protein
MRDATRDIKRCNHQLKITQDTCQRVIYDEVVE